MFEPDRGALLAGESVRSVAEAAIRNCARYVKGKAMPLRLHREYKVAGTRKRRTN